VLRVPFFRLHVRQVFCAFSIVLLPLRDFALA